MGNKKGIRRVVVCRLAVPAGGAEPLRATVAVKRRRGGCWPGGTKSRRVAAFTFLGPCCLTSNTAPLDLEYLFSCCRKDAQIKVSVKCHGGQKIVTRTGLDDLVDQLVAQRRAGPVTLLMNEDAILVHEENVTSTTGPGYVEVARSHAGQDNFSENERSEKAKETPKENLTDEHEERKRVEAASPESVPVEKQELEEAEWEDVNSDVDEEDTEAAEWEDINTDDEEEDREAEREDTKLDDGDEDGEEAEGESIKLDDEEKNAEREKDGGEKRSLNDENKNKETAASLPQTAWRHARRLLLSCVSLVLLLALLDPLLPDLE